VNKNLIDELIAKNVKINVDDIVFITRDRSGQIIWLETGNEMAGLTHIVSRHADDYNGRHCIISGIGTNGYIVTAYPAEKE
jgi:hypothetical protein